MDGLRESGANLFIGHSPSNLDQNIGCKPVAVVISSAIPADNVEVLYAKTIGTPVLVPTFLLFR